MNREEFAKRLDEIQIQEGTDPKILYDSVLPISDALTQMMPQSLFRYRSCTKKQIDAFQKDTIYAVSADLFNDPYDTLVRYDLDGIKTLLSAETYFDMMKLPLPSDTMGIIDRILAEKIVIQDEVRYSITELGALLFAKRLSEVRHQ